MFKKIEKTENIIKKFLNKCKNPYISVSFGKDSLVCMDIILKIKPDIRVVWVDRGEGGDLPDTYKLIDYYKKERNMNLIHLKTPHSLFELFNMYPIDEIASKRLITKQLKETFNKYTKKSNTDGIIWGLRAEESKGRRHYAMTYGAIRKDKNGVLWCSPVLYWKSYEIWAYIFTNALKYLNYYDITSENDFDRQNKRYSNWVGDHGISEGRIWVIKRYYPELFQKLIAKFPIFKSYA